jgi:hypothetical protein
MQVINTYVHFSKLETDSSASFINTFHAQKLIEKILGSNRQDAFKNLIANKCIGRHLVSITDFILPLM